MNTPSFIATGIFILIATGWMFCTLVSVVVDLRGGLALWWSRVEQRMSFTTTQS